MRLTDKQIDTLAKPNMVNAEAFTYCPLGGNHLSESELIKAGNSNLVAILAVGVALTACQGSGSGKTAALDSAVESQSQDSLPETGAVDTASASATDEQELQGDATGEIALATQTSAATPAQCAIQLAGGPPPKPPRGRDFGQAVVKNTGKAVQRGIIQQIGGAVAGGLGAAVAGGVAQGTIRQEEDIKGVWRITDGNAGCACEISVDSIWKLKGKGADSGFSKNRGCSNPTIKAMAAWTLGYSFTGYDSKFEFKAADKKTVLATLNRDGIHYFSGTLADGTPVVLWRDRQTYNQLAAFNKSVK